MSERLAATPVGGIVVADFRAAEVFERFGIDFCCDSRRSLAEACRRAAANPADVIGALNALPPTVETHGDVTRWPLPRLIDFIVATHHAYVRSVMPPVARRLMTLERVHGSRHPELSRVTAYFDQVRRDLERHILKEEQVLFPYVRDLAERSGSCGGTHSLFGTIEHPIRMLEREHREVADAVRIIRELTRGYTAPDDRHTTYAICMAELQQFERDLHRHVHLENNVLFPAAVRIEQRLCGTTDADV